MNKTRPKDFARIFSSKSIYNHVERRKDCLVDKLLCSSNAVLPLVRIYPTKDSTTEVLDYLQKWSSEKQKEKDGAANITDFSTEPPLVTMSQKNGSVIFYDYICVEYFRVYAISLDKTKINRYTYFEIYYDDYIVACLMDLPSFQKNQAFDCLEMDAKSWANAKMQMKQWNKAIYPEIEEEDYETVVKNRIDKYKELKKSQKPSDEWFLDAEQDSSVSETMDCLWPALAYLCLIQVLEVVPRRYIPGYALNFVCSNKELCETFSTKLVAILSAVFQNDAYIKGNIKYHTDYQLHEKNHTKLCTAYPYIFFVQRQNASQPLLEAINSFSRIQRGKGKWTKHPFTNMVPICVCDHEIYDSAILNITVSDHALDKISVQNFPVNLFRAFFLFLREKRDDSYTSTYDLRNMAKSFRKAKKVLVKNLSEQGLSDAVKTHKELFRLSAAFLVMCSKKIQKSKLSETARTWFQKLAADWKEEEAALQSCFQWVVAMAADDSRSVPPKFPKSKTEFEEAYGGICLKGDLLLYSKDIFKEKILKQYSQAQYDALLKRLVQEEYLRTNKNRNDYNVKFAGDQVGTIAFLREKLET